MAILLTLSGCASVFGIGRQPTIETSVLCARYPDASHPPIEFFADDAGVEIEQKAELITVWMVYCGVE